MSELRVDTITDELGTGSPDFPNGITVSNATFGTIDITGSTIESTPIGQVTPAAGDFTTLSANSVNIDGGTIDGTAINATTLTASGDVNFDSGTLFVDASTNNVGIGTTSPSENLTIVGENAEIKLQPTADTQFAALSFRNTADNSTRGYFVYDYSNDSMQIRTGGTGEAMRIDSSGNVGIGTTSPSVKLDVAGVAKIGADGAGQANSLTILGRTSDNRGFIKFADATNTSTYGYVGSPASNNLAFYTSGFSERMRIDSSGNLLVGGTSLEYVNSTRAYFQKDINSSSNSNALADQNAVVNISGIIGATQTEAASSLLCLTGNSGLAATPGRIIKGYSGTDATTHCFEVQHNGDVLNTNNSYGSISDERAKQDITDASSSWDDIKNIRIRKYRLKSNVKEHENNPNLGDAPYHIGVISQEVESVSPGLIIQDLLDNGTPDPDAMKYVKYSILYMKAVKALQESIERIETLEAKVAALKGANNGN